MESRRPHGSGRATLPRGDGSHAERYSGQHPESEGYARVSRSTSKWNHGRHSDRGIYSNSTPSIVCALKKGGPIMDMVLSFLISAGIIAFGVWVVVGTITAGWPLAWTIMGLLAILVGVLSLYGSVRDARTP